MQIQQQNGLTHHFELFVLHFLFIYLQQQARQLQKYMKRYYVLISLFVLLNAVTIHHSEFFTHMVNAENPHFVLTLEYGSLDGFDRESASAQIFWNSDKLGTLVAYKRDPQLFRSTVKVVEGKNKLTIKGTKDSSGIMIDNVKLVREGSNENIVQNGEFQKKPPTEPKSSNSFLGWTGNPDVAIGNELNKEWSATTVAVVGSDPKKSLLQVYNFDREYRLLTSKYFLSFQYAVRTQSSLAASYGKVMWNDQSFDIKPTDFEVHEFKREVTVLKSASNILTFSGEGPSDGCGLTIDNVRLRALGSAVNLVINGDFQIPHLKSKSQTLSMIPGWQSNNKEIVLGVASQFNSNWNKNSGQVLALNSKQNIIIEQSFRFGTEFNYIAKEKPYFTISFNYAAPRGVELSEAKGQLLYDGEVIAQFKPENNEVHEFKEQISLKPGHNEFTIRPVKGNSILIGDFKIKREGQSENIAVNGDFSEPVYKGFIVGWSGQGQVLDSQKANKHWKQAKVVRITSDNGISQTIELHKDFRLKSNKFVLEFQFVPTAKAKLDVPLGEVSWNGQVFEIKAHHRKINIFKIVVIASRGHNLLTLQGQGKDGEGVTIDNIKFTPFGSSSVKVDNGDFQDPEIKGTDTYKSFYGITDWDGQNIELGLGQQYSEHWTKKNGQVLSLATAHKTVLSKILSLSEDLSIFDKEPRDFKLSFKYAAEQGKPLAKSGGQIFWNKVMVGDIVPKNYEVNSYTITIKGKHGKNDLFIKGAGGLEVYGLTIDNIELYRQGSKDNLIENGNFEEVGTAGWNSIIDHAPLFNHNWGKNKVARIDAVDNLSLSKSFEFDTHYIFKTNKFLLKFNYALHKDSEIGLSDCYCHWNSFRFNLKPADYKVRSFQTTVFAHQGENVLKFEGQGITIDDVRLIPWGSAVSVLLNGGFEDPQFEGVEFKGIPSGWKADSLHFTKGYHASSEWPYSADQVITLTQRHNFVSQIVTLSKDKIVIQSQFSFHELQLDFAPLSQEELEDCRGKVYWNNRQVATLEPIKQGVNKLIVKLDVVSGENSLTIKGLESGIIVGNVDLVRYTLAQNIIENGKFNMPVSNKKIPHWQGKAMIADSEDYNENWQGAKVAVLKDGHSITQKFKFDGNLRLITKKLVLNFQYTVREGVKFQTAKAKVIWNQKVFELTPQDYKLHLFNKVVEARQGNNFIIFESDGVERPFGTFSEGFTLDDVWVRAYGSSKNLLINGGFQQPRVVGFDYGMFTSSVPGWITKDIYLGVGFYFSKNWVDTQIIELDGNHENVKIMQGIKIGKNWQIIQ